MHYNVTFSQVEVEADSEDEAVKIACKRMALNPEFYATYFVPLRLTARRLLALAEEIEEEEGSA